MVKLVSLKPAKDTIHKFKVVLRRDDGSERSVKFGALGMSDYTIHKDPERKEAYLARHSGMNEDWTKSGIFTPGFWSRWYLWNLPTKEASLADIRSRFGLE